MFNASSPVWDGSLEKIVKSRNSTPYIGIIIETGLWPAEQRINYSSLMLYHSIIYSSKDRLVKHIIQEQRVQTTKTPSMRKCNNSRRIEYKIRSRSNNEEIRVEKSNQKGTVCRIRDNTPLINGQK